MSRDQTASRAADRRGDRRPSGAVAALLLTALMGGCAPTTAGSRVVDTSPAPASEADRPRAPSPVRLAFFGDTHATGASQRVLTDGLGDVADLLASQDVVVGNLETAVLDRPSLAAPAPKQYTYAADPRLLTTLHDAGVDAVSLANNHGLDYGREGLRQTLGAARRSPLALIGVGSEAEAYAPWTTTVRGTRVDVLAATDVLDSSAVETWPPDGERAGLASTKGEREQVFLDAVGRSARTADVVVVFLHWGKMYTECRTDRQRELAQALADAGADVVVGSHAHVLQGDETVDDTYVAYGLGNFVWYSARPGQPNARTGVLSVTVDPAATRDDETEERGTDGSDATGSGSRDDTEEPPGITAEWHPATISGGIPVLDGGTSDLPAAC